MPTPLAPWQAEHSSVTFAGACAGRGRAGRQHGAGQVGGDVFHVLVAERAGLGVHGAVRALLAAVALQRRDDVLGVLADELGHAVGRVDVLVVLDAMTAEAGVADLLAALRVAGCLHRTGQRQRQRDRDGLTQ